MNNHHTKKKPIYTYDWYSIAQHAKEDAFWKCQHCSITQGEDPHNNITVHHKDHCTFNNDPSNLAVLCQSCHLREEAIYRRQTHYHNEINAKLRSGQRLLPSFSEVLFLQLNNPGFLPPHLVKESGTEPSTSLV